MLRAGRFQQRRYRLRRGAGRDDIVNQQHPLARNNPAAPAQPVEPAPRANAEPSNALTRFGIVRRGRSMLGVP